MARTLSKMLPLGTTLPPFALTDARNGATVTNRDFGGGGALLVMFVCNHCPFVIHVRDELTKLTADYGGRCVSVVAINSNSEASHPQDGPEAMKLLAEQQGWAFPFLFDATQAAARAFDAACTPDFYLFDGAQRLVYRGQLDDSRPGNGVPVTGHDLRAALDALLAGRPVAGDQKPSLGCNIKWAPAA